MKITKILNMSIALAILLSSCINVNPFKNKKEEEPTIPVVVKNNYVLKLPKSMKAMPDLNDEASLEYGNVFKELYTIVIDEPKSDIISTFTQVGEYDASKSALTNYTVFQLKSIEEKMKITKKSNIIKTKINGLNAEMIECEGTLENYNLVYFLTFIESKNRVFMIMSWTQLNKKEEYRPTFSAISKSFRLATTE